MDVQITAIVLFIFRSVGEGDGWFETDSTWLIHYKKPDSHPAAWLNSLKFCAPVDSGYSLVVLSKYILSGAERIRYYTKKISPSIVFHFFNHHKINLHLVISMVERLFFSLCFLKYESFFEGIYTCDNLTFHLQTEKELQFVSEMVCLHNA